MISIIGVATGTMALIIVLSVFNGFEDLIKSVFSTFDPNLKITVTEGKVFEPESINIDSIKNLNFVDIVCPTLEENVLLEYNKKQHPAVIKGVTKEFESLSMIDTMITDGVYMLKHGDRYFAVIGANIAYFLSIGVNFIDPLFVYFPKRDADISINPAKAFNKKYLFPKGVFQIQQEIDSKYVLVSMDFARELFNYPTQISAVEIKLMPDVDIEQAQKQIEKIVGSRFTVKNQFQQHKVLYSVMKSEKFAIYLILTFILIVASFNIIGSISMLIIDKKDDVKTLRNLGLSKERLQKIFMYEGWMISIGGAFVGIVLGFVVCWLQQQFGLLKLDNMGSFLINNYPVKMHIGDFVGVFITVVVIGLFASWYPVKYFIKKYN
jgi:lipoprotein-releasing system permease protein